MPLFRKRLSVAQAAQQLRALHVGIFSDKALLDMAKLCGLNFRSRSEYATGLSEWLFFGLYVMVEGIQRNCRERDDIHKAIATTLCDGFYSGLQQSGIAASEIPLMKKHVDERFNLYSEILHTSPLERLGFAVAACVMNENVQDDALPQNPFIFGLGIGINNYYLGGAKAVNQIFKDYKITN